MRLLRRATILLSLTALTSMGLTAADAAIYSDSEVGASGSYSNQSLVPCTVSNNSSTLGVGFTPVENGPATSATNSAAQRLTLDSDNTDTLDMASTITAKGQYSSTGGNPKSITLDVKGSVSASASKGTSQCRGQVYSYGWIETDFAVADAGWMLYEHTASKHNFAMIQIEGANGRDLDVENDVQAWNGSGRVFVQPGAHYAYLEGDAWLDNWSSTLATTPVNVSLRVTYAKAGSVIAKAKGKAKPYVKFPKARGCTTHDLELKTKGKASNASAIKFLVNGKTVKTVKNPKAGEKVKLKVSDTVDAVVTAKVTLKPTKKGDKPTTVESTGSYIACA